MSFFQFRQNNTGGAFVRTANLDGVVIIEADTAEEANRRAIEVGVYFDGCDSGADCPCCGDRWYKAYGNPDAVPSSYGTPVTIVTKRDPKHDEAVIHYRDGSVKYANVKSQWASLVLSHSVSGSPRIEVERQSKAQADAKMYATMGLALSGLAPKKKRVTRKAK